MFELYREIKWFTDQQNASLPLDAYEALDMVGVPLHFRGQLSVCGDDSIKCLLVVCIENCLLPVALVECLSQLPLNASVFFVPGAPLRCELEEIERLISEAHEEKVF